MDWHNLALEEYFRAEIHTPLSEWFATNHRLPHLSCNKIAWFKFLNCDSLQDFLSMIVKLRILVIFYSLGAHRLKIYSLFMYTSHLGHKLACSFVYFIYIKLAN